MTARKQKQSGHRTKKEAVTAALDESIQRSKQLRILSLFGTIEYDRASNYKRERGSRGARKMLP